MGADSKIEWTDHTFNPWIGCTEVSPACDHCYARDMAHRYGWAEWGNNPRHRTSPGNWKQPLKWNAAAAAAGERHRVFCASLADVFDNQVPLEWRSDLFTLIDQTPNLEWLLLTKRPENVAKLAPTSIRCAPNVMLGVTVESGEYRKRIWTLLGTAGEGARIFISYEPALGPLHPLTDVWRPGDTPAIQWLICGGESGPKARPMDPAWARDARDQAAKLGLAFLFKQWGEWAPNWLNDDDGHKIPGTEWMDRMGKKAAGRKLDGREHNEFPGLDHVFERSKAAEEATT